MTNDNSKGPAGASEHPHFSVAGLEYSWDLGRGLCSMGGFPVLTLFRDSSLASLMSGLLAMVGAERFGLALQLEGRKGTEGDWLVITQQPSFEQGFEALAGFAGAAGWGRWRIVSIDRAKREARFEITDSWEGSIKKILGLDWGAGLVGAKFADFGTRLFGTHCRAEQTASIMSGDRVDAFTVRPSDVSLDQELEAMLGTELATRADLANALKALRELSGEREQALAERERMVVELREQIGLVERQQEAIKAMSTPIIQVWDGVLVVPVVGTVDGLRTADIMEKLLEELVQTKSRYAILDLTGVQTIDSETAENFLKVIGGAQLLGARGVIAGINPQVAQTIVALGVNLGQIAVYANLKEALKAVIRAMGGSGGKP